ncbi:chemotaxis response regulator protein-glutamate methylesterase [Radiobacillus kanasensis]|uniref:protein-glutamate methylesterase/protein-glutamine glutaminase n=1 Tax=Radiobacillus kanasensis TaxID=2844358 RepID=UPI001E59F738|nr:chemotaxis response regulator protein-glutamate methylesterase [Radiobacillus kanasensis]UFU01044.1 chemotaxis response regulator protein-glutamate methylesterase [Radiobacillus kanasensis]
MKTIEVLVVDDSAFMRKMISNILNADSRMRVVGIAPNGEEALAKVQSLKPDVITLDVEMPVMDGISTLKRLMSEHPIPVVMLSSLTSKGAEKTLQAISLGAVDFIEKPSGSISLDIQKIEKEIQSKVFAAANANVKPSAPRETLRKRPEITIRPQSVGTLDKVIVGIGTSTGGPRALQQVLTQIPKNFPAPIVVVQHMPPGFTKSLAERLNTLSDIQVKEAQNGERLENGVAYIAPGGYHLRVRKIGSTLAAHLDQDEPRSGHRPSVDTLFESLAEQNVCKVISVIMTGMGADGSKGLKLIKQKHPSSISIAESERTSVVYGMPQAAFKTNLVDHVEDVDAISHSLVQQIEKVMRRSQ